MTTTSSAISSESHEILSPPLQQNGDKLRLLVCDPLQQRRDSLAEQIDILRHELIRCDHAADLLALVESKTPDVVLLAAHLPDGDSAQICRQLKNREDGGPAVIMIIDSSDDEAFSAGQSAGVDEFLTSPVGGQELLARLSRVSELSARLRRVSGLRDQRRNIAAGEIKRANVNGRDVEPAEGAGYTLLLVEDDMALRAITEKVLRQYGYNVITASDGRTALEMAERQNPDLVLLDVILPELNGYEVCLRLKSGAATRQIPVILVTVIEPAKGAQEGFLAGADDYLAKPVNSAELRVRIRTMLRIQKIRSSAPKSDTLTTTPTTSPFRILVIDDNDAHRRAVCRLLSGESNRLVEAGNGAVGLELAREHRPEIVLLDIQMPKLDGYEVCRRLRADSLTSETVVVMMTGLGDQESRQRGIEAGADDFLTKPVDALELKTRVANIIRLSRYRRLLLERSKFEWVSEQAEQGYILLSEADTITYANHHAREYLGITAEEPGPSRFLDAVSGKYLLRTKEMWASWPSPVEGPRFLLRLETLMNRALWLEVKVRPLPESGATECLVQISDVTERMESRRLRMTFESQVRHKLRTPLTALNGGLALLEDKSFDISGEDAVPIMDMVRKGGKRLQDSIREILEYIDAPVQGRKGEEISAEEIAALASCVAADVAVTDLEVSKEPGIRTERLLISRQAMETVLRELFVNAIKFHPHHTPRISMTIDPALNGKSLVIRVKDDGPGLPVEELQKVPIPYYQYEKTFTGQVDGMGLGLSVITSIIWSVGGDIRLRNIAKETGLEVEMTLPLAKKMSDNQGGTETRP